VVRGNGVSALVADGRQQILESIHQLADSSHQAADRKQQIAYGRQQAAGRRRQRVGHGISLVVRGSGVSAMVADSRGGDLERR
jgi:hypothetical protein